MKGMLGGKAGWLLLALLLVLAPAQALKFRPSTVQAMDLNVTMEVEGAFSGTVYEGDSLQIKFLTLNNSNTQQIQDMDERLLIGDKQLKPTYELQGGNKYAVFKLDNLLDYASTPKFTIVSKSRVKTFARIDSLVDYDLGKPMKGPVEEFLQPSAYIESDDPELQSKAKLEFSSTNSELETIREITQWVHSNITYDYENYYNGIWSAKDTYHSRRGVCDEFSNLSAAFLRAKGIPTMYVAGVSFDGERFGNHGWNEAYLGGTGWIGVDPTYGEAGYLDAAHLVLGKGLDANNLSNFSATTWSKKPIQVQAVLHDPIIEINGIDYFKDLTEVSLDVPKQLSLNEDFEVTAKVKNKQDTTLIIPLELALHDDFREENRERLELFRPGEEKTLTWKAVSPDNGQEGQYAKYGLVFLAPDQNIEGALFVYPKQNAAARPADIQVVDISPFIGADTVKLELVLENRGGKAGNLDLKFKYYGVEQQMQDILEGGQRKKFEFQADFAKAGKISVEINDGTAVKVLEIDVPQQVVDEARKGTPIKIEKSPAVQPDGRPAPGNRKAEETSSDPLVRQWAAFSRQFEALIKELVVPSFLLYVLAGLGALAIILSIIKFLLGK